MQTNVKGKNLEITNALREYAAKKTKKIEKYFESPIEATVTLSVEREKHIAEIMIQVLGILLRGEAKTDDMYGSIDDAIEKIEGQIRKYKTKINKKLKTANGKIAESGVGIAKEFLTNAEETDDKAKVIRTKKFAIKPMALDEAIMEMNLVGHDFFVFSNAETEEVNVVYRRKDGNYGLIEPEY